MANTKKSTTTAKSTAKDVDTVALEKLQAENAELKERMDKLMNMVENMPKQTDTNTSVLGTERDIPVMSLLPHQLNLTTQPYGQGTVYTFNSMYEELIIPYGDLKEIVRANRSMAQNGKFYILDEEAVVSLRLKGAYKTIIKPDELQKVLNNVGSAQQLIEIYKMAPQGQKQTIVEILKDKRLYNENVDMNVLSEISKISGVDLISNENIPDLPEKDK